MTSESFFIIGLAIGLEEINQFFLPWPTLVLGQHKHQMTLFEIKSPNPVGNAKNTTSKWLAFNWEATMTLENKVVQNP